MDSFRRFKPKPEGVRSLAGRGIGFSFWELWAVLPNGGVGGERCRVMDMGRLDIVSMVLVIHDIEPSMV